MARLCVRDQNSHRGRAIRRGGGEEGEGVDTAATKKLVPSFCPPLPSAFNFATSPLPLTPAVAAAAGAEVSLTADLASEGFEVLASAKAPVDSALGLSRLVSALRLPCARAAGWGGQVGRSSEPRMKAQRERLGDAGDESDGIQG
jgi:hypothetical protein